MGLHCYLKNLLNRRFSQIGLQEYKWDGEFIDSSSAFISKEVFKGKHNNLLTSISICYTHKEGITTGS